MNFLHAIYLPLDRILAHQRSMYTRLPIKEVQMLAVMLLFHSPLKMGSVVFKDISVPKNAVLHACLIISCRRRFAAMHNRRHRHSLLRKCFLSNLPFLLDPDA